MRRPLLTLLAALMLSIMLPATASADSPHPAPFAPVAVTAADEASATMPADETAAAAEVEAPAEEEAAVDESAPATVGQLADVKFMIDNLWILLAAFLVFIMHLGFSTLESGLTQAKNTTNILFKNVFIICIGLLTYAACGFNLMYPGFADGTGNEIFGFAGWGIAGDVTDPANATRAYNNYSYWTDFLFQGMFAATAATIISGCVAERIKLLPFLIFATIYVGFLYPWVGSWHWGYGWLYDGGFYDFAGSTLVHSVGGWGGLAAILVLGPRRGKYVNGQIRPILPSNLPLATIGVFLLWFGWFGFNGGSVLSADPAAIAYVCTTTSIAAAIGGITAGVCSWVFGKKPDLSMALNGILAGLVGITAGPDTTMLFTVIIGLVCGVAVYFAVLGFDKLKIDDPVGALSVHLVCGIIGTRFAAKDAPEHGSLGWQAVGVLAFGATSFIFAFVLALICKATLGCGSKRKRRPRAWTSANTVSGPMPWATAEPPSPPDPTPVGSGGRSRRRAVCPPPGRPGFRRHLRAEARPAQAGSLFVQLVSLFPSSQRPPVHGASRSRSHRFAVNFVMAAPPANASLTPRCAQRLPNSTPGAKPLFAARNEGRKP
jgi:Amt family ammonium transporter